MLIGWNHRVLTEKPRELELFSLGKSKWLASTEAERKFYF